MCILMCNFLYLGNQLSNNCVCTKQPLHLSYVFNCVQRYDIVINPAIIWYFYDFKIISSEMTQKLIKYEFIDLKVYT